MTNNPLGQNHDHIGGNFDWEFAPDCSCGLLKAAIDEEKFLFVSNFTDGKWNVCYMVPLASDGQPVRSNGVNISYCPWCGDRITVKKRYG